MRLDREREFLQATLLHPATPQNMQQAGTQKWLRCVLLSLGCGERIAPAWSQDGGQGENHKVKIEAARARTCPAQITGGTTADNKMLQWQMGVFDGPLRTWVAEC